MAIPATAPASSRPSPGAIWRLSGPRRRRPTACGASACCSYRPTRSSGSSAAPFVNRRRSAWACAAWAGGRCRWIQRCSVPWPARTRRPSSSGCWRPPRRALSWPPTSMAWRRCCFGCGAGLWIGPGSCGERPTQTSISARSVAAPSSTRAWCALRCWPLSMATCGTSASQCPSRSTTGASVPTPCPAGPWPSRCGCWVTTAKSIPCSAISTGPRQPNPTWRRYGARRRRI